ncbi:MAG: 3-methyl-2-oxobutanoate hydroxymethyltransferase [Ignavibacteria bacterium GWF2_33_9]|nr:MAG: 3-methyl-2-oxobutanoate hydroxymethyltransferase [Ignavibacteria bacterium GWF2_33_9]
MSYLQNKFNVKKITTLRLQEMKQAGKKIAALTSYDALTAKIFDDAGIELLLVGDSLGNVVQGLETTIPVTLDQVIYHTKAVVNGARRAMIVADMPFMTFQISDEDAFYNAGRLMKEGGAEAVKMEGGRSIAPKIKMMTESGIPVMGHLGLTPQSIHKFGSYRARGTTPDEAERIMEDALILQDAGVFAIVLEKIPAELGKKVSDSLSAPTIGIGAGPHCDGQILVYTDMLGITTDFSPRFVRRYARLHEVITESISHYLEDVKNGEFPNLDESY